MRLIHLETDSVKNRIYGIIFTGCSSILVRLARLFYRWCLRYSGWPKISIRSVIFSKKQMVQRGRRAYSLALCVFAGRELWSTTMLPLGWRTSYQIHVLHELRQHHKTTHMHTHTDTHTHRRLLLRPDGLDVGAPTTPRPCGGSCSKLRPGVSGLGLADT